MVLTVHKGKFLRCLFGLIFIMRQRCKIGKNVNDTTVASSLNSDAGTKRKHLFLTVVIVKARVNPPFSTCQA